MRLFAALELPGDIQGDIEEWGKPFLQENPDLKWTARENLHVTLRFFGDLLPGDVAGEMKKLNLEKHLPVGFTLNRSGSFGRPPSVLWLGGWFSREITEAANLLGNIPDDRGGIRKRRFFPHVTVARARTGREVPRIPFLLSLQGESSTIALFSSTLTPSGPVYRKLLEITS